MKKDRIILISSVIAIMIFTSSCVSQHHCSAYASKDKVITNDNVETFALNSDKK